jgi:CRP-like cAMP-binding protein
MDSDIEVLRGIPFFGGFTETQLKLIAMSAESRSLPEKLLLYDEGQLLHSAYVIVSGSLKGERKAASGERTVRREIGPGVILGERALILDARAPESVRVESRTRVLQIRKLMFRKLLQEHPEMATLLRARLLSHVSQMAAGLNAIADRLRAVQL